MDRRGELDLLMAAAWPPLLVQQCDGWLFRSTSGVSRRANSVLVVGQPDDMAATVAAAESFYRTLGTEALFLVSDALVPSAVPRYLQGCGFGPSSNTWMLYATTTEVLSAVPATDQWAVRVSPEPTDAWFDTYWVVESTRKPGASAEVVTRNVLLKPDSPAVFVSLSDGDDVLAVGQIVIRHGWACTQCLVTVPTARGQGAAAQILRHLAREAEACGVTRMFAAVMADNEASLSLCRATSFRRSHRYSYYSRQP